MTLNILTNFCGYWWLAWLLPFILGLILGWLIWGKWARKVREIEDDLARAHSRNSDLDKRLKACTKEKEELTREARENKHQLSAVRTEVSNLKAKQKSASERSSLETNQSTDETTIVSSGLAAETTTLGSIHDDKVRHTEVRHTTQDSRKDKYAKISEDNLQIIEGIGPKMEQVLKENSIKNLRTLANTNATELRAILNKYGDKYKIIDPKDWTQQATLASNHKWDKLIDFQKADGSDAKAEKMFIKMGIIKAYAHNDLKVIEGIGPKISELLMSNGINTWKDLANSSESQLREVLDSQGTKYKLADPSTWPKQAQMAAAGDWDKLEEYQDFLNGGKNPS